MAYAELSSAFPETGGGYIMYMFSGGGYGGWWETDGLTNGCSSVGISKTQPVEILEQHYPQIFEEYALREGSGGAGRTRGGFGVSYRIRLLRDDLVVHTGGIASLRRESDDVRDVREGFECGVVLKDYRDIRVGDIIESFEIKEVKRTLA